MDQQRLLQLQNGGENFMQANGGFDASQLDPSALTDPQ